MAIGVGTAILGGAILGGGASLLAGREQAKAAESAARLTSEAASKGTDVQERMFLTAREDLRPYRETGANALRQYAALYGIGPGGEQLGPADMAAARAKFLETPGYQFRFDEGVRAVDRSAASRGKLQSGAIGRELTRYGQGVASDEFNTYANRLAALAGSGQGATTTSGTLGQQTGANIAGTLATGAAGTGNALFNAGTARASGYAGAANAATGGIQNYLLYDFLNRQPQPQPQPQVP